MATLLLAAHFILERVDVDESMNEDTLQLTTDLLTAVSWLQETVGDFMDEKRFMATFPPIVPEELKRQIETNQLLDWFFPPCSLLMAR